MKILSIDSCTEVISIALIIEEEINEKSFPSGKDFSENILPEITILLSKSNLKINDVDAIAFGSGPGSFTGIRIACGLAYGIAYANNLPIVGVSSLEALALLSEKEFVISCVDARMNQLYLGIYQNLNGLITPLIEPGLFNPSELPKLPEIKKATVIGSGLNLYKREFATQYGNIRLSYFKGECSLAAPIGILSKPSLGKEFNLQNAAPTYIRNKVAQTTKERLSKSNFK
mgnify:CR=1 FL=1